MKYDTGDVFEDLHNKEIRSMDPKGFLHINIASWMAVPGEPAENWKTVVGQNAILFDEAERAVDLDALIGKKFEENTVYAVFESEKEGIAQLGIGCDWWYEAYCNGVFVSTTFPDGNNSEHFMPENHPFFFPVKKGENLLAVRILRGSQGMRFCCGPVPLHYPRAMELLQAPLFFWPDTDHILIEFFTSGNIGAGVEYRKTTELNWTTVWDQRDGQILRREKHRITLNGLDAGTGYCCRIAMIDLKFPEKRRFSDEYFFHIPDKTSSKFSFFYTADLQFTPAKQQEHLKNLLKAVNADECDFFVFSGDIGSSFDPENVTRSLLTLLPQEKSIVYVRGNHELRGELADTYLDYFATPEGTSYTVFRFGDTAFLALDCWEDKPADSPGAAYCKYNLDDVFLNAENEWFKNAMASEKWTSAKRRIVLAHGAPYSHYDSCMTMPFRLQDMTDPYFAGKNPVSKLNLWFAGHTHRYSRSIPGTDEIAAFKMPKVPAKSGEDYIYPVCTVPGPDADQPHQSGAFRVDGDEKGIRVRAFTTDGVCFEDIFYGNDGKVIETKSLQHFAAGSDPSGKTTSRSSSNFCRIC